MDDLKKGLSNISLYDVKAYVRKAQNVVYNYTEMEAKVREATNNEPWGASSTSMQQIAAGTYNYREREEIVGMIFRRFTEKSANEWRQVYKALQLLEYLVKNGSERFVDDARANLSLIQMLRSFHYIDSHGRDQGINVRNKSKTLTELLNNDSILRAERKKARDNSKKFKGVAGGAAISSNGFDTTGGAEGDYDEEEGNYDTYEGRIFGDGGVYGERFEETRTAKKKQFEEYDPENQSNDRPAPVSKPQRQQPQQVQQQPEVDLFSFDGPSTSSSSAPVQTAQDDDEFGDFQTATSTTTTTTAPSLSNNLNSLYHSQPATNNNADSSFGDFTSFVSPAPTSQPPQQQQQQQQQSSYNNFNSFTPGPAATATKQDAFSSLFSAAASKAHTKPTSSGSAAPITKSTPAPVQASAPAPAQNGEINLLDF